MDNQKSDQPLKSALFVDFDNIYLGLRQLDEAAAERFATDPSRWLTWMEQGMPSGDDSDISDPSLTPRRILLRRCYLNPRDFYRYRPNFTRAAFNVIDCPSLTSQGKNSADIYMVMDVIDMLEHKTHIDEFIILSGDADFTPVVLRLRAHDRRTAVLAAGPASEAYKAACDMVIQEDVFIEYALGMSADASKEEDARKPLAPSSVAISELMDAMAAKLYAEASANGEILATDLPKLYLGFPEFRRDSNWLGYFSLRSLTAELTKRQSDLRVAEGDPWRVTVQVPARPARARRQPAKAGRGNGVEQDEDALRRRIVTLVRKMVAESAEPILMAKAAHDITNEIGQVVIDTRWAGAGTFKNLLQEEDLDIEIATAPSPGYLYDRKRHAPPSELAQPEPAAPMPDGLPDLIKRVNQATGTPDLTPPQYGVLFKAIAEALKQAPYNLTRTSKIVRDLSIERGESISRANVSFVLKGIIYKGHRFGKRDSALELAKIYSDSVIARCEVSEVELTGKDEQLIDAWILGGLKKTSG